MQTRSNVGRRIDGTIDTGNVNTGVIGRRFDERGWKCSHSSRRKLSARPTKLPMEPGRKAKYPFSALGCTEIILSSD